MNDLTNKIIELSDKQLYCYKQNVINGDIYLLLLELDNDKINYKSASIYQYIEEEESNKLILVEDSNIIKLMISVVE